MENLAIDSRPWEAFDPRSVTAEDLCDLVNSVDPINLTLGQFDSWQNWWQNIPGEIIHKAMYEYPFETFRAEYANAGLEEALDLFCTHSCTVRDLRESVNNLTEISARWMKRSEYYSKKCTEQEQECERLKTEIEQLRECGQALREAELKILQLKAELYDMGRKQAAGEGDGYRYG